MVSARGCPGSTCISPVWLERCKLSLYLSAPPWGRPPRRTPGGHCIPRLPVGAARGWRWRRAFRGGRGGGDGRGTTFGSGPALSFARRLQHRDAVKAQWKATQIFGAGREPALCGRPCLGGGQDGVFNLRQVHHNFTHCDLPLG